MHSIKTRGVIIKRMHYGEADRILTVFTERLGKIKVLAKGVRKITSKLAGNLEPYNIVDLELHQGKTFYTVTSAQIYQCLDCDKSLSHSTQAVYLAEIIDRFFEIEEKNAKAFEVFCQALKHIKNSKNGLILRLFELKILAEAGFRPDFYKCASCKKELRAGENKTDSLNGDILCSNCGEKIGVSKNISDETIKLLRLLQTSDANICQNIKCETKYIKEAEDIIDKFLQNALERELKSKKYLKDISI